MKKFLAILILIFTLQTPSQADDIRDFQIEGMSIGDSLLDYFSEEEISEVAKLMKINLEDHSDHVKRVQKMLEYFDILDNANVESEEIIVQETDLGKLRDDKYNQYDKNLLKFLKSYQEKYVKAPKLN